MKILSWNVNGLLAREEAVRRLAQELRPDVMCFQKEHTNNMGCLIRLPDYLGFFHTYEQPQKDFGGVASFYRRSPDFDLNRMFGHKGVDGWIGSTGNIQTTNFDDFILVNAYAPYSNSSDEKWIKIRQRWDYEFHDELCRLAKKKPLIVCGDLNIVAEDIDAWDGVSVKDAGCFYDWEHRNFNSMLKAVGLVDSYRALHPDSREFSYFFENRPDHRLENKGYRTDYFLVSEQLMHYVKKSEILTDVFDTPNNPILLEIDLPNSL